MRCIPPGEVAVYDTGQETEAAEPRPPQQRNGNISVRESVGELGIYGSFVASRSKIYQNVSFGHLLRSKGVDTKQGGVFMGHAVIDSPLLV